MTLTDEELDRDWVPNGRRPQSTIAQMFSQELMDIFRIENSITDLDEEIDRRKQQINSQTSELEQLEARIREMERKLQEQYGAITGGGSKQPAAPVTGQTNGAEANGASAAPPVPEKDLPLRPNATKQQQQQQQQAQATPARSEDGEQDA